MSIKENIRYDKIDLILIFNNGATKTITLLDISELDLRKFKKIVEKFTTNIKEVRY